MEMTYLREADEANIIDIILMFTLAAIMFKIEYTHNNYDTVLSSVGNP